MDRKRFGDYLIDGNLVTPDQLQRALELQILQLPGTNTRLGHVLVQLGAIEEQDVALILEQQKEVKMEMKLLGQYLVDGHQISEAQVQKALEVQANSLRGGQAPLFGTVLVEMGAVKEQDVTQALEQQEIDRSRHRMSQM
ncbi:MAG: hypothetical protein HY782_13280 [Chloroflexi bacterium]|nr:hypothetical protein [Chloroflexota bacterium]